MTSTRLRIARARVNGRPPTVHPDSQAIVRYSAPSNNEVADIAAIANRPRMAVRDLRQIEYFVRVAELGNFTRASSVLSITQLVKELLLGL